ncbi:hypothetical protein ACFXG4_32710 [Nocardia sp. NPDC059246]|uniref:hypothetical protein n=1 Tax=Nocardia sp. NPDC059246 TaxID=3346789 RepID=UPI0036BE05E2
MLPIGITVLIITLTVLAAIRYHGNSDSGSTPAAKITPPTENTTTDSGSSRLPTTDIFGNRLETPADPGGVPLPQEPILRPNPNRPDYLTATPARLQWQRGWGGAALPISGSDGPATIAAGVASGFADTPQGAALAACDAIARALSAPEELWRNVVHQRFLGGGAALTDRLASSRLETLDAATYVVVPEGIRVLPGYQPDFAVVQIAVRATGGWAYANWPMAWSDGDWRVRVPDDIESLWASAVPVTSLAEFGSWKGTSL